MRSHQTATVGNIPNVESDDFESLLPSTRVAHLSEEVLKFLATTLVRLKLSLDDARHHVVSMFEGLSCK